MKNLRDIIQEKLKIGSKTKVSEYSYYPKDRVELRKLLEELFNKRGENADLNDIDTSEITDMSDLFEYLDPHNIDISKWDVSNVTTMEWIFYNCKNFNSDLSNWNVSNVKNMKFMFYKCMKFNSDLSKWDVSNVKDMTNMFSASPLEKNLPKWYHE